MLPRRPRPSQEPAAPRTSRWSEPPRLLCGILVVAFAVRIVHLVLSARGPFFEPVLLDAKYYHEWARRIVAGDLVSEGVFYGLPLYPYFLALLYALGGGSVVVVKVVQALIALVTVWLTYRIGARLADSATGLLAALLTALYGPLVFHETMLIPEALGVPLYAMAFDRCCRFLDAPSTRNGALAGLILGMACLTKAGVLPFAVLFVAALGVRPRLAVGSWSRASLAALGLSLLAVLLPVTLHNRLVGGDWVFLTSHAGLNFYIGNNPNAEGVFRAPEGTGLGLEAQIADSRAIAEAAAGRALKPSEISAYWSRRAWAFIREQPLHFLALSGRKLLLVLDARELSDLEDYDAASRFNPFLAFPWPSFALVGPLGLLGLLLAPPLRHRWCVLLWLGGYLAGLATFFVNARYRLPLLSVWLVLAALGLRTLAAQLRARDWPRLAAAGLVLLAGVSVSQLALVPIDPARDIVNAANLRLDANDYGHALALYEQALSLNPDNAQANLGLGIVLDQLGRGDESGAFYERSVAASPDAIAYNNLGTWYHQRGRLDEAERAYRRAVELKPQLAQAHNNLGIIYSLSGDDARAIDAFATALRHDPRNCKAATNLGLALKHAGRPDEARRRWAEALERDPTCASARHALDGS